MPIMKSVFYLLVFAVTILLVLYMVMDKHETVKSEHPEVKNIISVLHEQQKCWNNGDIDGFMQGYWNSEDLVFTSTKHIPTYGWQNTLERYKNSYPTQKSMGVLKFEFLHIAVDTDNISADLNGCWELVRKEDNPKGEFFLKLKKLDGNWKITKDSTTSY